MIYKCRACEHEEARGCLPTVTCGIYLFFLMGIAGGLGAAAIDSWRGHLRPETELGWWNLLVVPLSLVLCLVGAFIGAVVLNYILEAIEYLVVVLRKCPKCGARRWTWGFTRGFGL